MWWLPAQEAEVEDPKLEASLGYIVRPSPNRKKKEKERERKEQSKGGKERDGRAEGGEGEKKKRKLKEEGEGRRGRGGEKRRGEGNFLKDDKGLEMLMNGVAQLCYNFPHGEPTLSPNCNRAE